MKTKTVLWMLVIVILSLALSACSGAGAATPTSAPALGAAGSAAVLTAVLPDDYADALSARNQLALGTLRLAGTADAVTPEQAQMLAFLWQGFKALSADTTVASEELTAVQQEITAAMGAAQLNAIRGMRLTSADLNAFYEEQGLPLPTPNLDNPDSEPGSQSGRNMTEEERAARRAEREAAGETLAEGQGGGSGAARRDALIDAVIALLAARAE